jgi:ABC-type transport system substrate-binding protein
MIRAKFKVVMIISVMFLGTSILSLIPVEKVTSIPAFFTISVMSPNTNPAQNQWATLMVEQLPKIGIGVDKFVHTGLSQIPHRTWNYSGPYPVPTFAEGGYDILFQSQPMSLSYNPKKYFDAQSIVPNGTNIYQYSINDMNYAIDNYLETETFEDRLFWANKIQTYLYNHLPTIGIAHALTITSYDVGLSGWNPTLWVYESQSMENWSIPGHTEFHYAVPGDFINFHPLFYENSIDQHWLRQIFGGLLCRNSSDVYHWIPRNAVNYTTDDGLTYHFHLNPNIKWADGVVLNATDIFYTFNFFLNSEYHTRKSNFWKECLTDSPVKIINEFEVEISFRKRSMLQEENLALEIIPSHIWSGIPLLEQENQAKKWALTDPNKLLGTGPYYLENYAEHMGIIHLKVNPFFEDWSGISPNFTDVYFEFWSNMEGALDALDAGSIDMVDSEFSPSLANIPYTKDYSVIASKTYEIAVNTLHPYIGTGELCSGPYLMAGEFVRKAISYLIPRETIVSEILSGLGEPAATSWPITALGYNSSQEYHEYSINMARYYMNLAGFPINFNDSFLTSPTVPSNKNTKLLIIPIICVVLMTFLWILALLMDISRKV